MTYPYDRDLPDGYAFVRTQDGAARIILSTRDADALEQRRLEAQIAAQQEKERLKKERDAEVVEAVEAVKQAGEAAAAPATRDDGSASSKFYRVVHDFDALENRFEKGEVALRTPDDDVRKRILAIVKRLRELGPDRRIAWPRDWRTGMADLRAMFPNFVAPLDLVGNSLALADATDQPVRLPPMLLLGPPGVGKTYFSHRLAEFLGAPFRRLSLDQSNGPSTLMGTSAYWSNTRYGVLFDLLCLGAFANPVILLDEIDKAARDDGARAFDPLAEMHGALEPETSRRTQDQSVEIDFDASMVTYVATANSLRGIDTPILSRFEIFEIAAPDPRASVDVARAVAEQLLRALRLEGRVSVARRGLCVLSHLSPRLMHRVLGKALAAATAAGQEVVTEEQLLELCGLRDSAPVLH